MEAGMERNAGTVLVCGGRKFTDWELVQTVLDQVGPALIIHGAAKGADTLAGRYARERGIPCRSFPVVWHDRWGKYMPGAAFDRNQRMLDEGYPDLVVAFPGEGGTRDMVRRSRDGGFPVRLVDPGEYGR